MCTVYQEAMLGIYHPGYMQGMYTTLYMHPSSTLGTPTHVARLASLTLQQCRTGPVTALTRVLAERTVADRRVTVVAAPNSNILDIPDPVIPGLYGKMAHSQLGFTRSGA